MIAARRRNTISIWNSGTQEEHMPAFPIPEFLGSKFIRFRVAPVV
jgi:hypothetical protein